MGQSKTIESTRVTLANPNNRSSAAASVVAHYLPRELPIATGAHAIPVSANFFVVTGDILHRDPCYLVFSKPPLGPVLNGGS